MSITKLTTKEIAAISVMGALTTIATMIFMFPIPATSGYFNFGDAIVMSTALIFGPLVGAIAGGIGSALADQLAGWYDYVFATMIIKGVEGYVVGCLAGDSTDRPLNRTIIAWVGGSLVMVAGYFFFQAFRYGFGPAYVELPFNLVQMLVAGVVGIPVSIKVKDRLNL